MSELLQNEIIHRVYSLRNCKDIRNVDRLLIVSCYSTTVEKQTKNLCLDYRQCGKDVAGWIWLLSGLLEELFLQSNVEGQVGEMM